MRFPRGSVPPHDAGAWLAGAIRARFPKLAVVLGQTAFDALLHSYLECHHDGGARLAGFIARLPGYPTWLGDLAAIERALVDVLHAPASGLLSRRELTAERELRLIPAAAVVSLTTAADEAFIAIECGMPLRDVLDLDAPRTMLVWRTGAFVRTRTVPADEAIALRAALHGTTVLDLTSRFAFRMTNPKDRAMSYARRWLEAGLVRG